MSNIIRGFGFVRGWEKVMFIIDNYMRYIFFIKVWRSMSLILIFDLWIIISIKFIFFCGVNIYFDLVYFGVVCFL